MTRKPSQDSPDPLRILVVDDEEGVRSVVSQMLQPAGYQTVTAADGPEALGLIESHGAFDLVVTDLLMPGMTGDELGRRLRLANPDQRILYLTGHCDSLFRERPLLWSGEAYLDKPCTMKGLQEAVALLLDPPYAEP